MIAQQQPLSKTELENDSSSVYISKERLRKYAAIAAALETERQKVKLYKTGFDSLRNQYNRLLIITETANEFSKEQQSVFRDYKQAANRALELEKESLQKCNEFANRIAGEMIFYRSRYRIATAAATGTAAALIAVLANDDWKAASIAGIGTAGIVFLIITF